MKHERTKLIQRHHYTIFRLTRRFTTILLDHLSNVHDRIFTGRVHIYKRTIASHRHRFVSNKFVYVLSLQNTLVKWDCSSNIEFYSWKKLAFYWFRKVAVDWWNEYIYIWLVQETRLWLVLFDTVEPKKGERAQQCVPSFALTRQVYHGITATRKTNVITIQTPRNKRKKTKSRLQASSSTYKEEINKGSEVQWTLSKCGTVSSVKYLAATSVSSNLQAAMVCLW